MFQLKYGGKSCWFDCHYQFLPISHSYRKNKKLFRNNKVVRISAHVYLYGNDCMNKLIIMEFEKQLNMGVIGTLQLICLIDIESHNWNKKSIYGNYHIGRITLLRPNLNVMYIKTIIFLITSWIQSLNVQENTKDSLKSRLDLATQEASCILRETRTH